MVKVTVYVEGGSPGKVESKCRSGFHEFFKKAGLEGHMPKIVACGGRDKTLQKFRVALQQADPDHIPLLLVDSEGPVRSHMKSWQHLSSRDGWERPKGAQDEQGHLMVQCMESWFLADVPALEIFFGAGFRSNTLANRNDIENIPKKDVFAQLEAASRDSRKGRYRKGSHSFSLLKQIDPTKVIQRSPFAKRLVDTLKAHLISA